MKPETKVGRCVIWSVWAWGAILTTYNAAARKSWDELFPDWVSGVDSEQS